MGHRNLIIFIVSITTLCRHRYTCYELSSKDGHAKLSSHLLDSSSTPRDQANYHHYRRSDHHAVRTPELLHQALNSIPKSDKYQGWKPIISSRSLQTKYDRDQNQKLHSTYSNSVGTAITSTSEPTSKGVESRTTEKLSGNIVGLTKQTTVQSSRTPIQQVAHKVIKEDDIMWMHYGPVDDAKIAASHQDENTSSSTESNVRNGENETAKVDSKNRYHSQYRDHLRLDQSTRENPKNIYEIMDKNANSSPTFKPISVGKPETGSWQRNFDQVPSTKATAPASIDSSWLDLHDTVYNEPDTKNQEALSVENVSHENDIYDMPESKIPSQNEQRYYTRIESAKETGNEKGGKFLGKPIVIVEQPESETFPYFTAEYYRKLFDSFGRYDRSLDEPSHQMKSSPTEVNHTEVDHSVSNNRTDRIDNDICTSDQTTCRKNSSHKTHRRHRFDIFKMFGANVKDFVPKTLRNNIYFIKKLLVECYTESQDQNPTPIECLKKITTKILDKAVDSEVVKLTDNVSLVKENVTSLVQQERSISTNIEWLPDILEKMTRLFSTHSLRVQLVNSQEDTKHQIEGRRRHYRRVFPIVVGAYMILSTVLIPLGFKFMTLLGTKSLLLSKLSLMISLMGGIKKLFGYGTESIVHSYYTPTYYPTAAYPQAYPTYYDPWRRDEFRKISHYDDPVIDYSHFSEEVE